MGIGTLTSNRPRLRSEQGFTLLEIGLVLFILLLMAGVTVPFVSGLISEERLRGNVRELQLLARTARRMAMSENRAYEIKLSESGFSLEPYLAGENKKDDDFVQSTTLAGDVEYKVQRWSEKELRKPGDDLWVFQPDGLCEPIRIRFERGGAWIEFAFNPLTAAAQEETNFFP